MSRTVQRRTGKPIVAQVWVALLGLFIAAILIPRGDASAAGAQPSASATSSSSAVSASAAAASASASASSTPPLSGPGTTASAPVSGALPELFEDCPSSVKVMSTTISVIDDMVRIGFTHTGQACDRAEPTRLHVHQNLLAKPQAGSDPLNQRNDNFLISTNSPNQVSVRLLASVPGKCFVQVDVHVSGAARGRFVPTETCLSANDQTTSAPPPTVIANPPVVQSSAPGRAESPPPSQVAGAVLGESISVVADQSATPALAETGGPTRPVLAFALLLLVLGSLMFIVGRGPHRHRGLNT